MPRNRLPPWHEEFVLPNRRAILIRPIRPEDAAPLHAVFGLLGPAEVRAGFCGGQDALDEVAAMNLARPNPKTELVLVGAEPLPPGEAMIEGLARARIVPGTRQAEYAILLGGHVAGLGLGRHLMQKLVKWSRGKKLDRLYGDVLDSNQAMLQLALSLGFKRTRDDDTPGLVRVVLDLNE